MNNNYSGLSKYESYLGRQNSPWKSVSAEPVKKNHSVRFRPIEREELYPDLRGSYYSRIPPLSPHQYGSSAEKVPFLRNDASRPFNQYSKHNDVPSEIPGGLNFTHYQSKGGVPLDNHDRPEYGMKDHYTNGPYYQDKGHFFKDAIRQSEIPLYNARSSMPPHRDRILPNSDWKGYAERQGGTYNRLDRPQDRTQPGYSHEHNSHHYRRPHSHDALLLNGDRLQNTFRPMEGTGRDSSWGDRKLWKLDNPKRYNSLPALSERKRLDTDLFLPYDTYHREWPSNTKQWEEQRAFWDTSHLDPSYLRYLADPQNAKSFVERFVESCIKESLVLNVAAEVLVETREIQELMDRTSKPVILAAQDVLNEFIDEELLNIVKEVRQISVAKFWQGIIGKLENIEPIRDDIVTEAVKEELKLVAADAIEELVSDYFMSKEVVTIYNALYEDASWGLFRGVVEETLQDISMESLIDDLIDEEIDDCGKSFVVDVYAKGRPQLPLTNRQRDREALEIQHKSEEIAPDALILDVLLRNLKNRNQVWTDVEYKDKLLDGLILDQLLNQNLKIQEAVEATQENASMKQFHDDIADEEGLNTLMGNEVGCLDEDMSVLDQAEMELERSMYSADTIPTFLQ